MRDGTERFRRLNILVVLIVVTYTITTQTLFVAAFKNVVLGSAALFLTSIGFYELLVTLVYALMDRSDTFLKLYWGRMFLKGFWSYTYTFEGTSYMGVWRIEQDLFETRVIGYGIDREGKPRSDVRSVTDLQERNQAYEIVNIRTDRVDVRQENYSRTVLYPDYNPKGHLLLIAYPVRMRAVTTLYGGVLNGRIHTDVMFVKHEDASCEEDVVQALTHLVVPNNTATRV